mmetsp:Transcript_10668/g.16264  ORF Transcript_10668/g.16264 Transcript_10668/m.16264 type:complete len:220 (-) Transcript_10668:366-1025(-)
MIKIKLKVKNLQSKTEPELVPPTNPIAKITQKEATPRTDHKKTPTNAQQQSLPYRHSTTPQREHNIPSQARRRIPVRLHGKANLRSNSNHTNTKPNATRQQHKTHPDTPQEANTPSSKVGHNTIQQQYAPNNKLPQMTTETNTRTTPKAFCDKQQTSPKPRRTTTPTNETSTKIKTRQENYTHPTHPTNEQRIIIEQKTLRRQPLATTATHPTDITRSA